MIARSESTRSNLKSVEPAKRGEGTKAHKGLKDFLKRYSCHGRWRELVIKQKNTIHEITRSDTKHGNQVRVISCEFVDGFGVPLRSIPGFMRPPATRAWEPGSS